ncbi:ABC transporter permease [Myxococcota bacterium]|nr:ABC transporter permease [Myxococcota bacterium]
MRAFLQRLYAMTTKEILHMARDPQVIYLALGMPLVLLLLFGFAVRFEVEEVRLAVVDQDETPASRALLQRLDASDAFAIVERLPTPDGAEHLFRRGIARAVLVIPDGYARELQRGETTEVQLVVDGSDGTSANVSMSYAAGVVQTETQALLAQLVDVEPPIEPRIRTWFNPQMESALFVVPGLIAMILAIIGVLLAALTVAREWERGSMEQLFATPADRLSIVLGKVLPNIFLGIMQFLLVLVAGAYLFDVPMRGNFLIILAAAILFITGVLGQGLFISMVTKSQQVATQIGAITAILPSLLLSGFLFPIQNMPPPLRALSHIVPARWFISALRAVLLQGRGLEALWPSFLGLAGFAIGILALTTLRFRRRLD